MPALPAARAAGSEPAAIGSSNETTSALMKPRWKSLSMTPAAGAVQRTVIAADRTLHDPPPASGRPGGPAQARKNRVPGGGLPRYGPAMSDEDGYFPERVAARYDESSAEQFEPAVVNAAVDVLAGLADGGRALELGIGTGRIALPLTRRGVPVHGIDLSRAMVARLRAKPVGDVIGVTIGDFA